MQEGLLTDTDFVAAIRAGDEDAFEQLYTQHYPRLYSYASQQAKSKDLAAEIVQDVFLNIWRQRATFTLSTTLTSYLYVAVRNRSINARKAARRDEDISVSNADSDDYAPAPLPNPEQQVEDSDMIDRVWREVACLPENRREALTLRWRHGLKPEEIAGVMGISTASAKMLLSRALQTLKERFAE